MVVCGVFCGGVVVVVGCVVVGFVGVVVRWCVVWWVVGCGEIQLDEVAMRKQNMNTGKCGARSPRVLGNLAKAVTVWHMLDMVTDKKPSKIPLNAEVQPTRFHGDAAVVMRDFSSSHCRYHPKQAVLARNTQPPSCAPKCVGFNFVQSSRTTASTAAMSKGKTQDDLESSKQ